MSQRGDGSGCVRRKATGLFGLDRNTSCEHEQYALEECGSKILVKRVGPNLSDGDGSGWVRKIHRHVGVGRVGS